MKNQTRLTPRQWLIPFRGKSALRCTGRPDRPALLAAVLVAILPPAWAAGAAAAAPNVATGIDQFEIHPAFTLERVAGEPVLQDPVNLQFDEQGTAYVVEMGGYPCRSRDPRRCPRPA